MRLFARTNVNSMQKVEKQSSAIFASPAINTIFVHATRPQWERAPPHFSFNKQHMHMNDKMKQFLPSVDLEKMKAILDIEERFVTGKINLEQGREEVARRVGSLRPYHLAFIEQTMTEHTDDECIRENMAQKIKLFEGFMDYSRPQLPADHPITHYYEENDELKRLLLQVEDLVQYPVIKNQWIDLIERINEYPVHYLSLIHI